MQWTVTQLVHWHYTYNNTVWKLRWVFMFIFINTFNSFSLDCLFLCCYCCQKLHMHIYILMNMVKQKTHKQTDQIYRKRIPPFFFFSFSMNIYWPQIIRNFCWIILYGKINCMIFHYIVSNENKNNDDYEVDIIIYESSVHHDGREHTQSAHTAHSTSTHNIRATHTHIHK